ncbi:MAG TPA: M13 family metallopeptidase [Ferruginibacter sp.]|nr:M13 family metallopeptidase [Ferruginibacter sp.]
MIKRILFVAVFAGLVILPAITMSQKTGVDPDAGKTVKERQSTETPNSSNAPGSLQISSVITETVPEIKGATESKGDIGSKKNTNKRKFIDPANMDQSVKPGDNFYQYANGNWLKNNPVPASKTSWGSAAALAEESSQALKGLLEEAAKAPGTQGPAGSNALMKRVGDFYAGAMDSLAIESLGYKPIKPYLNAVHALSSKAELLKYMNYLRSQSVSSPLYRIGVGQDAKDVTKYIINIGQGGTTLPDRDYYLKDDDRSRKIRMDYTQYIIKLFTLCDETQVKAMANAVIVMQLETALAQAQMSRVEMRDPTKLYNKFSVDGLSASTANLDWQNILPQLGYKTKPDSLLVSNPKFMVFIDSLLGKVSLDDWKVYLKWGIIKDAAPYLSSRFVDANFAYNQSLSGQKVQTPRWQRMSGLIDRQLGDLLGQLYVDKYFNKAAKIRMLELVNNLEKAFAGRIQRSDWMSAETKQKALAKLYAFTKKIGFPDTWKNYDGLEIQRNDFIGNIRRCNQWAYQENINKLGKPVDKTEWGMSAPTVNAYYSPLKNEIVFPAGILRFPFFDFEADDAINYGGIGAVIGHEMTHGFDDQGRKYDADGNLQNWWTDTDANEFKKRAGEIIKQYEVYTVLDTLRVNGKLTLGENLADLGGLSIAYEAFKNTKQGKSNIKIDGFTPDQRFFLNWAQIWRNNILPEAAAQRIVTDTHSPTMYRANGPLTNFDAFYNAFNVQPGDKMYKAPGMRTKIW